MDIQSILELVHSYIFDPSRLPVAAVALIAVSVIGILGGPLAANAYPLFWRTVGYMFGPLGAKLDKGDRSEADLVTRGTFIVIIGAVLAFLVGLAFDVLSIEYPSYRLVDIAALSLVMSSGAVWHALVRLYKALNSKNLVKGAFLTIAKSSRTNLATSDEFTITRVGIGLGAKVFDKGVSGPVIWYLIGGLPAAYLYAGLAALGWRFGKEGFTRGFGRPALALEKLMGFVPNVLSGLLIAFAGLLTPTAGMTRAVFSLVPFRKGGASYDEGGAAVTAMAHALSVSLGGATQDLEGSAIKRGWAGPEKATAKLEAKHLHRAIYILVMAHLLFLAMLLGAVVIEGHGFFDWNA